MSSHTLKAGDHAPDFTLPYAGQNTGSETLTLSSLRSGNVVLYFYPKDDTPGCTLEAQDFTALADEFTAANTHVIGISKDSLAAHEKFRAKRGLSIPLVSDEHGQSGEAYGVWVEKNMYGRKYMGIERTTFLIDDQGQIQRVWNKVKAKGHASEVLAAVQAL
jgi:peroxiredoxin Q/BCP